MGKVFEAEGTTNAEAFKGNCRNLTFIVNEIGKPWEGSEGMRGSDLYSNTSTLAALNRIKCRGQEARHRCLARATVWSGRDDVAQVTWERQRSGEWSSSEYIFNRTLKGFARGSDMGKREKVRGRT